MAKFSQINGTPSEPKKNTAFYRIIQHLIKQLFEAEERRLGVDLQKLIDKNNYAYGEKRDCFLYQGNLYGKAVKGMQTRVIHFTLAKEVAEHIADRNVIQRDRERIQQVVFRAIDPCESIQDLRDALPNCLALMLPATANLPRMKPEGHSLEHDHRAKKLWDVMLPRIKMYSSARLIY